MKGKQFGFKPVASNPDEVYQRVLRRINDYSGASRLRFYKWTAVAASVALVIALSLWFVPMALQSRVDWVEMSAIPGAKAHIVLPDGTSVWLNDNARVRYPERFTGKSRTVEFDGEGFFEVESDKKRPFVVNMDGMCARVLGTSFNIHTRTRGSDLIEVTLTEGALALFRHTNTTGSADAILAPGQQALYDRADGTFEIREVATRLYSSWLSGIFIFENNSLPEIMESLERAFHVHIVLEDDVLLNTRLTAGFSHHETLDEILSILEVPAKFTYKKVEGRIHITPRQ